MSKMPRSKRILKMLDIVKKGKCRTINDDFGRGLTMNKNLASIQQMRNCVPGVGGGLSAEAPAAPKLCRELGHVKWAGLEVSLVMPLSCACGSQNMTPRTLGRYGPTAVLDASQVHVVLRQDVRCKCCGKQVYCSDDDVRRYFKAKGVHVAVATSRPKPGVKRFKGAGSGRKAVWHTLPCIATLYHTLRQTRSLEALRTAYMSKLQTRALESDCLRAHGSVVLQYWLSFVPASTTLRNLVRDFHRLRVSPQVFELRKCVAKRTRVYKVDGHRKAARLVRDAASVAPKTAILPIMNEEGCLVGPPFRVVGEGRVGFQQGLKQNLDIHIEANLDSSDKGALRAFGADDYKHQKYPLGELWLERWGAQASCNDARSTKARIDALEQEALHGHCMASSPTWAAVGEKNNKTNLDWKFFCSATNHFVFSLLPKHCHYYLDMACSLICF